MSTVRTILSYLGFARPVAGDDVGMAELCGGPLDGHVVDVTGGRNVIYALVKTIYVNGDPQGFQYLAKYVREADTGGTRRFWYQGEVRREVRRTKVMQ